MTQQTVESRIVTSGYTCPVLFVADVNRAIGFYVDMLGFQIDEPDGNELLSV